MKQVEKRIKKESIKELSEYDEKKSKYYANGRIKKKKILKPAVKITISIIFGMFFIILAILLFKLSNIKTLNNTTKIKYAISGGATYKVYLKDNNYYKEKYLNSGMQYISNLISDINLLYKYEIHSSEKLDYNYKYSVNATTLILDKQDKNRVIYEDTVPLIKEKEIKKNDTYYIINENIDIDYDKYNDYVIKFKRDNLVNADSKLLITMNIITEGNTDITSDSINKSDSLQIEIPLSEQTINIDEVKKIETSGVLEGLSSSNIQARALYIIALFLIILTLGSFANILITLKKKNARKTAYEHTVEKYLKEYDRAIVTITNPNMISEDYDKVMAISSIEEMLDLHDNLQLPILYYEEEPGMKSNFIIIKDSILYKLVIINELRNKDKTNENAI